MASRIDTEIIRLLQDNARITISDIARKVQLSENGVRYRLEKLERTGHIKGYTAILNPTKFNRRVQAVLMIKVQGDNSGKMIRQLKEFKELVSIYQITGDHSVMAIGFFSDMEDLNTFVTSRLLSCGVADCSVQIVMKRVKDALFEIP
ncbi:MAG: Lrp/AsnC family transcriptional regulator [Candidatus Thermoplasmatota archaeon]|nr:Lrp/AsnC family transcriptional regulator [Candidatus Thermoplasmatota archaeon]